jgi:hypothetical protein
MTKADRVAGGTRKMTKDEAIEKCARALCRSYNFREDNLDEYIQFMLNTDIDDDELHVGFTGDLPF